MAQDPTISQVCDRARWHLGDTQVAGGETYTNTLLLEWVKTAIADMQAGLGLIGAIRQRRVGFIPIMGGDVSQFNPRIWLPDCGRVVEIHHRPLISRTQITTALFSGGPPYPTSMAITCSGAHGRANNDQIETTGLQPSSSSARGMNSTFRATVTGANTLVVIGEFYSGNIGTGADSWLLWGGMEGWHRLNSRDDILNPQATPGIPQWAEHGNGIWISPPGTQVELRLVYEYEDPTNFMDANTIVGYPGSLEFLGRWVAFLAGSSKGAQGPLLAELRTGAIGAPTGGITSTVERPTGGALHALIVAETKRQQRTAKARPPYRVYRRPIGPIGYGSY